MSDGRARLASIKVILGAHCGGSYDNTFNQLPNFLPFASTKCRMIVASMSEGRVAPYPDENLTFASDGRTVPREVIAGGAMNVAFPSGLPATGPGLHPGAKRAKSRQQQQGELTRQKGSAGAGRPPRPLGNQQQGQGVASPQPPVMPRKRGSGIAAAAAASRRPASAPRMRSQEGVKGSHRQGQRLSYSATQQRQSSVVNSHGRNQSRWGADRPVMLQDDDSSDEENQQQLERGEMGTAEGMDDPSPLQQQHQPVEGGEVVRREEQQQPEGKTAAVVTSAVARARGVDLGLDVEALRPQGL